MRFGVRALLLIGAVFLFLLALILEDNQFDLLILGLALFAGAHLVDELGIDRGPTSNRTTQL